MTTGERIKLIRKNTKLTLEKFGARIQISAQSVSRIESGVNNPSAQTIALICREFDVSETWLRTGAGQMYQDREDDELDAILDRYGLPRVLRGLFERYGRLSESAQEEVEKWVADWVLETAEQLRQQEEPTIHGITRDEFMARWPEEAEQLRQKGESSTSVSGRSSTG